MVAGKGPQPALGMIVGEAPGRTEVERGEPFVGRSGGLLDIALRALGIDRSEVYVTNVVKELPLDSDDRIRKPYDAEVQAWLPILEAEIQHTAPRCILALGTTAWRALTGDTGPVPWGRSESVPARVVPAWHPSYLLQGGPRDVEPDEVWERWLAQIRAWAEAVWG